MIFIRFIKDTRDLFLKHILYGEGTQSGNTFIVEEVYFHGLAMKLP